MVKMICFAVIFFQICAVLAPHHKYYIVDESPLFYRMIYPVCNISKEKRIFFPSIYELCNIYQIYQNFD